MNKKIDYADIVKQKVLEFKNNAELKRYYEDKYDKGGYIKGVVKYGIKISKRYHNLRLNTMLGLLNLQENERILDVGCGTGDLLSRIQNSSLKNLKLYGIDISQKAIDIAGRRLKSAILSQMNAEKLSFKSNTFDKVISVEVLNHVIAPGEAIEEIRRVLKPDGELVVCIATLNKNIFSALAIRLKIAKRKDVSEHLHDFSYDELIKLIQSEGFKLQKSKGIVISRDFIYSRLEERFKIFVKLGLLISTNIFCFPRASKFVALKFKRI